MTDGDVSFDGEGQRAVDGAHETDVGRRQKVWKHVDPEHLDVFFVVGWAISRCLSTTPHSI